VATDRQRRPSDPDRKIVVCTYGSPGDLLPFLAVARALRARGHRPTVATSPVYRPRVEALG